MHYREISRVLGVYLFFFCGALLIPLGVAFYFQFFADPTTHPQPQSTLAFAESIAICLALGLLLRWFGRKATGQLYRRDALGLVVSIWFLTALVASLPFSLSGTFEDPLDSYWEAISGLTTTGASVMTPKAYNERGEEIPIEQVVSLTPPTLYTYYGTITPVRNPETGAIIVQGVNAVSRAVLFWRSFLQWLGGMGIVVLFLAILPALGVGGKVLYQAEVTGPIKDSMTPRIKDMAGLLWKTYLILSIVEVLLLIATNKELPLFDAVTITFANLSTGGFTIRNDSIGFYHNPWTDNIILIFMLIGSINFAFYINFARRKFTRLWDPELFVYCIVVLTGTLIMAFLLMGTPEVLLTPESGPVTNFTFWSGLRYGAFQLISAISSTGFATANYDMWPFAAQVLMLTFMYVGGMSGSTSGGIKIIRHSILVRATLDKIQSIFRPHRVHVTRIGRTQVDTEKISTVFAFFFIVIALTLIGTFLLVLDGVDPETALSVMGCCQNNVGLAFRMAGPTESFAFLPPLSQIVGIMWMVAGRLEYFAVLVILLPDFWRRR